MECKFWEGLPTRSLLKENFCGRNCLKFTSCLQHCPSQSWVLLLHFTKPEYKFLRLPQETPSKDVRNTMEHGIREEEFRSAGPGSWPSFCCMYMVLHGDNGEKNTLADGRAGVHALELPLKEIRETTLKLVFVNALLHLQSFSFS